MTDRSERCLRCGTMMKRHAWTHTPDDETCLRIQLAQAQEELQQSLAREVRLRRVVEEFTDFAEHGGRFVLRPMAETITVNGVVYTPIQWVYDYLENINHQIRLQAERALANLRQEEGDYN